MQRLDEKYREAIADARELTRNVVRRRSNLLCRSQLNNSASKMLSMSSTCRICSRSVVIRFPNRYASAFEWAERVDNMVLRHGDHSEVGNWGIHWMFDEVLNFAFPDEHTEEFWPTPPWYTDEFLSDRVTHGAYLFAQGDEGIWPDAPLGDLTEEELRHDYEPILYKGDYLVTISRITNNVVTWEYLNFPRVFFNPSESRTV